MKKRFSFLRNLSIQRLIGNVLICCAVILFVLGSTFFVFAINSRGGFDIIISKFWLPLAILTFVVTLFYRKRFYRLNISTLGYWWYTLIVYMGTLGLSYGYGLGINAYTGSGEIIVFEGEIFERDIVRSKGEIYIIKIIDNKTKRVEDFRVDFSEYNRLSIRDNYKEQFYKGGFGILYRWGK